MTSLAMAGVTSTHLWKHSRASLDLPSLRYCTAIVLYLALFSRRFFSVAAFDGKGRPSNTRIGFTEWNSRRSTYLWKGCYRVKGGV